MAGLSAALELKRAGLEIDVFERTRLLGGRATSFEVDGREVDNGQHVFLGCCTEFIAFVREVGLGATLHLEERFDVVAYRGGVAARLRASRLPAPWHLLTSFLRYGHLRPSERFAVARALRAIPSARTSQESFAAWLARERQPAGAIRAFWEPFVVPALNAPLDRVTTADAAFVIETAFLHDRDGSRFGWCTVPLAHVAQAAAARADRVRLSAPVVAVAATSDAVALTLLDGERCTYDAVVLALPPPQLARLLGDAAAFGLPLDGYEPWPIVDVHLWHTRRPIGVAFAALLESPVQWIFRKGDDYLCASASAASALTNAPTGDVIAGCWEEVRAALPALRDAALVDGAVTRNPNATYLAKAGVRRPRAGAIAARIAIAGSWTDTGWPDTMESAIRSGRAAAQDFTSLQRSDAP